MKFFKKILADIAIIVKKIKKKITGGLCESPNAKKKICEGNFSLLSPFLHNGDKLDFFIIAFLSIFKK